MNVFVTAVSGATTGIAKLGTRDYPCTLGRAGIRLVKVEGDGATPAGRFPLRRLFYRPDRYQPPRTALPIQALRQQDGWCDDPADSAYNRLVALPYPARHEELWRTDHLYDLILVIGHNDAPIHPGDGSAVFIHLMRDDQGPTEGCVAFRAADLIEIVSNLSPDDHIQIDLLTD